MRSKFKPLFSIFLILFILCINSYAENNSEGFTEDDVDTTFSETDSVNVCPPGTDTGRRRGEIIYFVMPDRFSNGDISNDYGDFQGEDKDDDSNVLIHGLKRDDYGYYHGGDIKGVIKKINYLKQMGFTAIWITPIFKNNAVQGDGTIDGSSSAYHGYWITDFMEVDPHLGTNEDLKKLVRIAHRKGIKVYLDIITNHTADIIKYEEDEYSYKNKNEFPFRDAFGDSFNDLDHAYSYRDGSPFPELNVDSFPYTPVVDTDKISEKFPGWLNEVIYYHNRGDSTFSGENSVYGDFAGLDDLFTAHPQVISGMLDIYKFWIKEFNIDGFRIDTTKHVNIEFWQQFVPEILEYAKKCGIKDFYMFGEVYDGDPATLSKYTKEGKLPAVLDFGFQSATSAVISQGQPTQVLKNLFINDDYYTDDNHNVYNLPTFLGNHDMGRIGAMIRRDNPNDSEETLLKRSLLAHKLLYTVRGVPTVYYGDEQGFTGVMEDSQINDRIARQNMFPSEVDSYNDPAINKQIGADTTPEENNFYRKHPIYQELKKLAKLRKKHPAFSKGTQIHRYASDDEDGDIYAFSRFLKKEKKEYVIAINSNPDESKSAVITTFHKNTRFRKIYPKSKDRHSTINSNHDGKLDISVQPLEMVVYKALKSLCYDTEIPEFTFTSPANNYQSGSFWVSIDLEYDAFAEVSFYVKEPGKNWEFIGKDDNPPYRVNYNSSNLPLGTSVSFRAVAETPFGRQKSLEKENLIIENRMPKITIHYENENKRDSVFGIFSNGNMLLPEELTDDQLNFEWIKGSNELSLFFETKKENGFFDFDMPVYISLTKDIYPNCAEANTGGLETEIYINCQGEVSVSDNFCGLAPDVMAFDPDAEPPINLPLYIRGGMNGWEASDQVSYIGNYTYRADVILETGEVEFKFADADWAAYNFGTPCDKNGINEGANPGNIRVTIPEGENGLYDINFFSYPAIDGTDGRYSFFRFEKR